jgi:hypothetical protein
MAFSSISSLAIAVGSAIKRELWLKVKDNFDDLDSRVNSLETSTSKVPVMKFDVRNAVSFSTLTGMYYWEADDNFTITSGFVRIFEKGSLTGTLEIDIKKSTTDLDGPSFSSIFTTKPSINFATAANYDASTNQVFDPTKINISQGDFLRLDITQTPSNGVISKFLITLYGE